ncbi:MAG: SDR family oxidoreductase [Aurantimicrobium sp.]|nr:SDR family oxidoreductase [Aurantimicrobium sp.]
MKNLDRWSAADIPDLTGKRAIVTGATSGLGLVMATELAAHGATVTLAARNATKAETAKELILSAHPKARLDVALVDVASLKSVRSFATTWLAKNKKLDILVNNAGVMAVPKRQLTEDGFELQFGTNHLGAFALTLLLLPALRKTPGARVVAVASNAHRPSSIAFDDLMREKKYTAWGAYGQSKLANLLFTRELQRRFVAAKVDAIAVAGHPGWASTNLVASGPMKDRGPFAQWLARLGSHLGSQSAEQGALPMLYVATAEGVAGNDYYGPHGTSELKGYPVPARRVPAALSDDDAKRLWNASEALTAITSPI